MLEQNINVPDVLTRPLKFGDPEQIAALKIIEKEIEEKEETERMIQMRECTEKLSSNRLLFR